MYKTLETDSSERLSLCREWSPTYIKALPASTAISSPGNHTTKWKSNLCVDHAERCHRLWRNSKNRRNKRKLKADHHTPCEYPRNQIATIWKTCNLSTAFRPEQVFEPNSQLRWRSGCIWRIIYAISENACKKEHWLSTVIIIRLMGFWIFSIVQYSRD